MGLGDSLDDLSKDMGDVSDIVGGYIGGGSSSTVAPTFIRGEQLGTQDGNIGGAHPPDDLATHNLGAPIEFIHFGYVHPDDSKPFEHSTEIDDILRTELGEGAKSRAIMFRAALEREAILLNGFIVSTQRILAEREAALGGIGEVVAVVTDLIGGEGGGSKAPKASDLNDVISKVAAAGEAINKNPITYTDIHNAGIALAEARAQYRDFLGKIKDKPEGDKATGLLDSVDAVAGALGGLGDAFSVISGIATKAFDIYVAFYAYIAFSQEPAIEKACREISIQAIEKNAKLIFPVWAHIPEEAPSSSTLPGALGDAVDAVTGAYEDVRSFFDGSAPDCPGTAFLPSAFSIKDPSPANQPPPMPTDLGTLIINAFRSQIKFIPDDVLKIIQKIVEYDVDFIQAVYQKLIERIPDEEITYAEVLAAGRRHLLDRLLKIGVGQSSFLQDLMKGIQIQTIKVSPERFINEALDALNSEILSKLDPVFQVTMKDFAQMLEALRFIALQHSSHTMEMYLGRLPYLLALLFRDTFFPIWDLIVEYVFGPIGGPPLQAFMDSFRTFREGLQGDIDSVRDYVTKADKVANRWEDEDGIHAGSGPSNVGGYMSDLNSTATRHRNPEEQDILSTFPMQGRKSSGSGTHINNQEWETVNQKHKWETALRSEPVP
jgi:hypothetical protein